MLPTHELRMFFLFLMSVSLHFGVESAHAVDQSIVWDVLENANFAFSGSVPLETGRMGHKNLNDVNSIFSNEDTKKVQHLHLLY